MGKFDNIAILSDLDGTFLSSRGAVVSRNIEAIEYFKENGGLFSVATGRMHYNFDQLVPDAEKLINAIGIMCNGTYFYDFKNKKVFCEKYMDGDISYEAIYYVAKKYESAITRVSYRDGYIINSHDPRSRRVLGDYGNGITHESPIEEWNSENWYKFAVSDTPETLAVIEADIEARYPGIFECNRSSVYQLEYQMKGTNKASLLGAFREYYRSRGKNLTVYHCGDNENDIEMLMLADFSVCPSNSISKVKEISDMCFSSNDEGVIADLIYFLDKK